MKCNAINKKARSEKELYEQFPNLKKPVFQTAVAAARFTRAKLYSTMPTREELEKEDALQILGVINTLLESVPIYFQTTWMEMLHKAFPELQSVVRLPLVLQMLVVRCWMLRRAKRSYLHDFVEFCAGQGNLSMECMNLRMFGATFDIDYTPDHNMMTATGLRVMIDCISKSKVGALNWWGTKCSSHVSACYYHHQRGPENGFWGNQRLPWVRDGNLQQVPHADECRMISSMLPKSK